MLGSHDMVTTRTLLSPLILFCVVALVWSPTARAYLDPGTDSLLLPALLGAIAAAAVAGGVYWQKLKNLFSKRKTPVEDESDGPG